MRIFLVRGDDIFEAEHLPSYARTYILPRQMVRKSSQKDVAGAERSRKPSQAEGSQGGRKQSEVDADFQFSMLKASLDYDTEVSLMEV